MIKKQIRKAKDGYRIKVWHTDNPGYWVQFKRLPDIEEARARQRSAEHMLFEGSSTDDAGANVREMIRVGLGKRDDNIGLIGRIAEVVKVYAKDEAGNVVSEHRCLTSVSPRYEIWADLKDGRHRRVYKYPMDPRRLNDDLHYLGGVLYWKNEKREPVGYCIERSILILFYIGEK